jgi:hypothetical protein
MGSIKSANPDSEVIPVPSIQPSYTHGMATRRTFIPMAFQVTSPLSNRRVLMPHALVMHVNPQNYSEQHNKKLERIQTRGGWVEQHWGDDLTEITCDGSTGAFMNIYTGLTALLRQRTIQWDRYRDLLDLFRNNGSLYDPYGAIVLQGNIMLMYDRGTYNGYFKTFEVEETDDSPFAFKLSFSFKVQEELMKIPNLIANPAQRGAYSTGTAPAFQGQNAFQSTNTIPGVTSSTATDNLTNFNNATIDQRTSAVQATLMNSVATPAQQASIQASLDTAQTAQQQGNATAAFQALQAAQEVANALPPRPPSAPTGKGLPTNQGTA